MIDNSNKKRYLVYLASNQPGLDIERYEISRLLAQHGMLNIGLPCWDDASPYDWELVKEQIEIADLFILLLGDGYGPVLPTGISYLHREFVHAKSLNKPVLAFLKNSLPEQLVTEEQRRLAGLHRIITQQAAYKFWHLRDELLAHVRAAVSSSLLTIGPGWVPTNSSANNQQETRPQSSQNKESLTNRQRQSLSRQMLNLQVSSKVYEGGNLTLINSFVPSRLDLLYQILQGLLQEGASEDRLRKHVEQLIAEDVKKEQLERHPNAHAVDDIRVSRNQFQQILKSWNDLDLVKFSGIGSRVVWQLP